MILNFTKYFTPESGELAGKPTNFADKIINGIKIHTIRHDKHKRWYPGRIIQYYTGLRTKMAKKIMPDRPVISIQEISIVYEFVSGENWVEPVIYVDDKILNLKECKELAINDGFDSLSEFFMWFSDNYTGKIIHWTEKKY